MSPIKTVILTNGSLAPALGMGSWHLAEGRHPVEEEEEALRQGVSLGINLIDTAEVYAHGASEQLVGRAIAGQREKLFLVSKISPVNTTSPQSIRHSFERSLRNLDTTYLDLYLLHWRSGVRDLKIVLECFEAFKQEGRLRHWGVSNFGITDLEELFSLPNGQNCAINQMRYSLSDRSIETLGIPDWCLKHNMPLMAYSPLGRDFDMLRHPLLADLAQKHTCQPAAIAIAWTMRSNFVISIPESGNIHHIRENAKALSLQLDAHDLAQLDHAFPARYNHHWSNA